MRDFTQEKCQSTLKTGVFAIATRRREEGFNKLKCREKFGQIKIIICYDPCWNKRSSGSKYDRKSADAFTIDALPKRQSKYKFYPKHVRCVNSIVASRLIIFYRKSMPVLPKV